MSSLPSRVSLDSFRSPSDRKGYCLVTLPDGLEVLLVQSDTGTTFQSSTSCNDDGNGRDSFSSMDDTDFDSTEEEEGQETTKDRAPPLAAVCLTVDIGSLSDPRELPGLAHYLEHMIFMGSEKYPDEDAFEAFLSAHGGSSNGATECESTRFVFDVDAAYLAPALDMFASLFVAPLLKGEAMERELKAVESEFQRVRNNNPVRLQQVMCETSVQGHPYSRCFTWGNVESLKHCPERDGIDVREQMLAFFKRHYVAQAMKLCVYGCASLDVLEQYVTQSFGDIPSCRKFYDVPRSEKLTVPYGGGASQRPEVLRVIPVGEKRSLRLYWMLPAMQENYRQKPWYYVGHLLGHEGPESMASTLKRRKWATDVIAGTSDRDGYEFGSFGTVFEVRVTLTEQGLACWEQVARVIFDALHIFSAMAATGDLPAWVFQELRSSSEMDFRFQEDGEAPVALCRELSERMLSRHKIQQTCEGDLLRYDLIQGEFDALSVCALLAGLSADNVRVVLTASSFADTLNSEELQTERWFGTKYSVNPIPESVIAAWSQPSELSIGLSPQPTPNPFVPRRFSVLPYDSTAQVDRDIPPDLILTTSTTQLWYKRDRTFLVPKASVSFLVTLPAPTAATHMLAELHVELVRHRLQHTLEQADTASFDTELDARDEAIEVVISGFSDTLPALVLAIMREVLRPSEASEIASELALARGELEREYRNAILSPRAKAYELRLQMLESRAVTTDGKLEALLSKYGREKELAAELAHFTATVLGCSNGTPVIRCLVIGNMTQEAAVSLVLDVEAVKTGESSFRVDYEPELELEPEPPLLVPRCHTIALPPTTNGLLVRRQSERVGERNSVVEVYFQIGKIGPEDRAYAVLLRALLAQPLFHELRTRQQLGYTVTCSVRDTHGVLGLSVSVQSASHAAGAVAKKLDVFLHEDFPHEYLLSEKRLSSQRFAAHVQTLQRAYARPDSTLTEQSERYWEEIVSGRLEFDLDVRVANALGDCTREGLLARYHCWLQGSTSCCNVCTDNSHPERKPQHRSKIHGPRKLRVHVVGKCSPFKPIEQLVPPEKTPVIITGDLHAFKRELQCHCHVAS